MIWYVLVDPVFLTNSAMLASKHVCDLLLSKQIFLSLQKREASRPAMDPNSLLIPLVHSLVYRVQHQSKLLVRFEAQSHKLPSHGALWLGMGAFTSHVFRSRIFQLCKVGACVFNESKPC